MKEINAYPLCWPAGWKRIAPNLRARARFHATTRQYSSQPGGGSWLRKSDLSVAQSSARVLGELCRFGVLEGDAIVSTNLKLRLDGLPRSDQAAFLAVQAAYEQAARELGFTV